MSGLIVRPGDTLFVPLLPDVGNLPPAQLDKVKQGLEGEMPGVSVVVLMGPAGGPFVYRPGGAE